MNYQYWQEISFYLNELDKEKEIFEKSGGVAEVLDTTRQMMSTHLENLKTGLEKMINKHNASLILFAIVAAVDEKMQSYVYNSTKLRWSPLQKDFYSAYTAGEVFYKSLDEILENPETPNIVFQVYYTMLKRGFKGKYQDSKTQIAKYMDMLKDKIPTQASLPKIENIPLQPKKKGRFKKWHFYGIALSSSCLVLSLLYFVATYG